MSFKHTATKMDYQIISLMGGESFEGITFTKDQIKQLRDFYNFTPPKKISDKVVYNSVGKRCIDDINLFVNAGDERNLMRHTQADGLRVMAFLSRYLQTGEDPVRLVAECLAERGYDVCLEDLWTEEEEE